MYTCTKIKQFLGKSGEQSKLIMEWTERIIQKRQKNGNNKY